MGLRCTSSSRVLSTYLLTEWTPKTTFLQISSWWHTCVVFFPTTFLFLRVFTSLSHGSVIAFKNVTVMKNAKSGWTRKCLCYFIYPNTEKLLKRLWLIGKWDLVGQKHLKLLLLTFPSRTSLRVRIDVWIVRVLLIISGWKCLPKHFTGGFGICFPSLQRKGSHRCQCVPVGTPQFIWLNKTQATVSSRTLCILDTLESKSNLCSSCNYTSQKENVSNNNLR